MVMMSVIHITKSSLNLKEPKKGRAEAGGARGLGGEGDVENRRRGKGANQSACAHLYDNSPRLRRVTLELTEAPTSLEVGRKCSDVSSESVVSEN